MAGATGVVVERVMGTTIDAATVISVDGGTGVVAAGVAAAGIGTASGGGEIAIAPEPTRRARIR